MIFILILVAFIISFVGMVYIVKAAAKKINEFFNENIFDI